MNSHEQDEQNVCYYLRGWAEGDQNGLQAVAKSGVDVWLHAEDIQRNVSSLDILEIFKNSKVHIISYDVDDKKHHLEVAFQSGLSLGYTHLVYLNNFAVSTVTQVLGARELVRANPRHLICYTELKKPPGPLGRIIQRSMQIGGEDYRDFKTEICCYPLKAASQVAMGKSTSTDFLYLLVQLLRKSIPVTLVESSDFFKKTKRSINYQLKEMGYDIWLLGLASFKENSSPKYAAISLAVGVFLACTPFYGLQTLLIFLTCYIFRLSFPIAFIGSQVSLPPIYSLLVPLQIYAGAAITGQQITLDSQLLANVSGHFYLWLIGSLTVGASLAIFVGMTWYVIQTYRLKVTKLKQWSVEQDSSQQP